MNRHHFRLPALVLAAALIAGCSQENNADPQAAPVGSTDTDRFWIFPNPGKDPATGVYTTNDASYAQAYYAAIDPSNLRSTLAGFKSVNGFGTTVAGVTEVNVIFRDARDLGYGRKMTVRFTNSAYPGWPAAHRVAVHVENYQVVPYAGADYTGLNLDAAIAADPSYHVGTNAIEYSIVGGVPMTRFYTYSPSGTRLNTVNLDGRGQKAMPSVCINCHGGRADPLYTSRASGSPVITFPNGGNVRARLQPIHVDSVEFSGSAPWRRADQEEALRQINHAVFCAHSLAQGEVAAGVDTCRPPQGVATATGTTGGHDYQGAEAAMIKSWYSSGALDTPGTAMADTYLPIGPGGITGWADTSVAARVTNPVSLAQQQSLYANVVAPYCRVCHALRGTENQSDIDFTDYLKFEGHADRIKAHVFDRGNMPLGLLIYKNFWASAAPEQLADWLVYIGATNPARVGGGPTGAPVQPSGTLTDPAFLAMATTNTPNYAAFPKPTTFATIKAILQNANTVACAGCHYSGDWGVGYTYAPPIAYANALGADFDRDGDGDLDPDDDREFYKALRGRVNLTEFLASPLLRKPTGHHHAGGKVLQNDPTDLSYGTACAASPTWPSCQPFATFGAYSQAVYDTFRDWIEHGAPYSYTGSTPNY